MEPKITVYDLDSLFREEMNIEAFRYKKAAIFEGRKGVVFAEEEAVHEVFNSLDDEVKLPVNPIAPPGKLYITAKYELSVPIRELMEEADKQEMTMEEFFTRRNYNPRCQDNYEALLDSLKQIDYEPGYYPWMDEIAQAAKSLYHVQTDADGKLFIDVGADYNDRIDDYLQILYDNHKAAFGQEGVSGTDHPMLNALQESLSNAYIPTITALEDEILHRAGIDPNDERAYDQIEYLREHISFKPPLDHYMDQTIRTNLILGTPEEADYEFGTIRLQFDALIENLTTEYPWTTDSELSKQTGLTWLVQQQGYTMKDLEETMNHCISNQDEKIKSPFLRSVCDELLNMSNYSNGLTVLAAMSVSNYAQLMKPGMEVVLPKSTTLGLFSHEYGGGSDMGIELEKDLVIPSELIWDAQIEGAKPSLNADTIGGTYAFGPFAWEDISKVQHAPAKQAERAGLDEIISSAMQTKAAQEIAPDTVPHMDQER